jgi:hypothetical protein
MEEDLPAAEKPAQPDCRKARPFLSKQYYQQVLNGRRRVRTFLILFLAALLSTVKPAYSFLKVAWPVVSDFSSKVKLVITEAFPEELEVKIKAGQASVNVPEPYYINASKEILNTFLPSQDDQKPVSQIRLLVIDTASRAEDFERYQSLALLTKSSLVYYEDGSVRIRSLRSIGDLTINQKELFAKFADLNQNNRIETLLKIILVTSPLMILVGLFFEVLLNVFVLSFLFWLMVKIRQTGPTFRRGFVFTAALAFPFLLIIKITRFFLSPLLVNQLKILATMAILGLAYTFLNYYQKDSVDVAKSS